MEMRKVSSALLVEYLDHASLDPSESEGYSNQVHHVLDKYANTSGTVKEQYDKIVVIGGMKTTKQERKSE
jgi:hypothetical protein